MEEEIRELILKKFPGKEIEYDTNLSYLSEDSFGRIEMLMEIEQSLGIRIPEEDVLDMETVGELADVVRRIKNSNPQGSACP